MHHSDLERGVVGPRTERKLQAKYDALHQRPHDEPVMTADECMKVGRDPERKFEALRRQAPNPA